MRNLAETDRPGFTRSALEMMKTIPDGPGTNYLIALLLQDVSFPSKLCDPAVYSLSEAAHVARRVQKIDPRFDVGVARQITDAFSGKCPLDMKMAERLLDLISSFSDPARVLALLAQLLRHQNPRIRSKTVLLIGRASSNARLAESYMREPDKRVRANAIEALWGNQAEEARAILTQSVADPDNRVAANAVMGLYKLGDTRSIALLRQMAEHGSAARRASAVWAMKETADPRFLRILAGLIGDEDSKVRHNAFHALAHIRKSKARLLTGEQLRIIITEAEAFADGQRKLRVSVCSKSGPVGDVSPLEVLLEEDRRPIADYTFQEIHSPEPLALGIAIPRILQQEDEFRRACEASIQHCLPMKRRLDQWAILRYATEPPATPSPNGVTVRFATDPAAISETLHSAVHREEASDSLKDAASRLIAEAGQKKSKRQILLIDGPAAYSRSLSDANVNDLQIQAKSAKTQVHGLISAESDAQVNPRLRELCRESGGKVIRIATPDEMPQALQGLCCSLVNRYEITYAAKSTASPVRISVQLYSPAGFGEQSCDIVPAASAEPEAVLAAT